MQTLLASPVMGFATAHIPTWGIVLLIILSISALIGGAIFAWLAYVAGTYGNVRRREITRTVAIVCFVIAALLALFWLFRAIARPYRTAPPADPAAATATAPGAAQSAQDPAAAANPADPASPADAKDPAKDPANDPAKDATPADTPPAAEAPADASTPEPQDGSSAPGEDWYDQADPENAFDPEAFYVNLSQSELNSALTEIFGEKTTLADVKKMVNKESFVGNRVERNKRIRELLMKHVDSKSDGFQDSVAEPNEDAIELFYGKTWKNLSLKERLEKLSEDDFWKGLGEKTVTNGLYYRMMVLTAEELIKIEPSILEVNKAWLPRVIEESDKAYAEKTLGRRGCYTVFDVPTSMESELLLSDEHILDSVRLWTMFHGGFAIADPVITTQKSTVNYGLNMAVQTNDLDFIRYDKPEDQEDLPAILLSHTLKGGRRVFLLGINIFDWRVEFFDPRVEIKEEAPKPVTPAPVTPAPVQQPKPKVYALRIFYKFEDGSQAAPNYTASLAAGATYTRQSPKVDGYTPDRGTVSGTMPASNHDEWVTYHKVQQPKAQVYPYREFYVYQDGSNVFPNFAASYAAGTPLDRVPPAKAGYRIEPASYKGTMPAGPLDVKFTYYPVTSKLTVRYIEKKTGKSIAQDKVRTDLTVGQGWTETAVTVNGYKALAPTTQSGNKKATDETITFYYEANAKTKLTVQYLEYGTNKHLAQDKVTEIAVGQNWTETARDISGYTALAPTQQSGVKQNANEIIAFYYQANQPQPLEPPGTKNPAASNGNQNPDHPNGDLNPSDGPGDYQPTEPPAENNKGTQPNSGSENNGTAGSPQRQEVDNTPVSATDSGNGTSSGLGQQDHPVVGPGTTHGGTPPDKGNITDNAPAATVTTTTTTSSGTQTTTTTTESQGDRTTAVSEPLD